VLSFIVPAHNEEALIGETLTILKASAEQVGEPFEIIVADDASTDRTAEIARLRGASVVPVEHRQIAATRNAGARAARGDILIFVDADTHVYPGTIRSALEALRAGAVGGGARIRTEQGTPRWGRLLFAAVVLVMRITRWAAGCFLFVRREAFEAVGGFDERYFATEELVLSRALKRRGRMVIVAEPVVTSGRKMRLYHPGDIPRLTWRYVARGRSFLQRRENLHLWYDGRREKKDAPRRR
jgi:glycosyltransferase involved in cell wall biosynthesis